MVDPFGAAATFGTAARSERIRRKGNASNVILVTTLKPRTRGGYQFEFEIRNRSPVGISAVVVLVEMTSGELELSGKRLTHFTTRAGRAIASGDEIAVTSPHVARFPAAFFDADDGSSRGYVATLYWKDEVGKTWRRCGDDGAERCSAKEHPFAIGRRR